jgi:formate--tetrahydrofolate ligase
MAKAAVELIEKNGTKFKPLYPLDMSIHDKILTIATKIYGASNIEYTRPARRNMKTLIDNKLSDLPICIAKTQNSISDDPSLKGAPSGYTVIVQGMRVSAGAGFIVVYLGDIMTMPGLPRIPAAENIDINDDLEISGLF